VRVVTRNGYVQVARCLALDVMTAEVVTALRVAGIEVVLLKGPATVRWLYVEDPGQRPYGDADLLVAPSRFDDAGRAMSELGFRDALNGIRASEASRLHELAWDRAPHERVELHRSFGGVGDADAFWAAMRRHTSPLTVAAAQVAAPDRVAGALLYALHAAHHGQDRGFYQPLKDLRRAVEQFDDAVWLEAAELATEVDAAGPFAVGLSLDPGGRDLADRLSLRAPASSLTWLKAKGVFHSGDMRMGQIAAARTSGERLQMVRDGLFPSHAWITALQPELRGHPLALAAAYLRRWLTFAIEFPRAVLHWCSATVASRRSGWPPFREDRSKSVR